MVKTVETLSRVSPDTDCVVPESEPNLSRLHAHMQRIVLTYVFDAIKGRKQLARGVANVLVKTYDSRTDQKCRISFLVRIQLEFSTCFRSRWTTLQDHMIVLCFVRTTKDPSSGLCRTL